MRKRNQFQLPKMLIGIVILLAILLLLFKISPFNRAANNQEILIAAKNILYVNVITNTGDVKVSSHDGDKIRVQLTGKNGEKLAKRYKLKVKEKNNELTIKAKKKSRFAQDFLLSIELPNKQYEALQVEAEVANIDVGAVYASTTHLQTEVGNIIVRETEGMINAKSKVGNVELQFQTITNNLVAKADVGNVVVKIEKAPTALQTTCKTSIGTTTINLPNVNNGSIGTGGPHIELVTEVGDVSVLLVGE